MRWPGACTVRDRVRPLFVRVLTPQNPTALVGTPILRHVSVDRLCRGEIFFSLGAVIHLQPGDCPPAGIIQILVLKIGVIGGGVCCGVFVFSALVLPSLLVSVTPLIPSFQLCDQPGVLCLGIFPQVVKRCDVGIVFARPAEVHKINQQLDGVRRRPPRRVMPAFKMGARIIPLSSKPNAQAGRPKTLIQKFNPISDTGSRLRFGDGTGC